MSLLTTTPKPSLAVAVKDARVVKRAEKAAAHPLRRWGRRFAVGLAMTFALLGFSGGTAQAWPWDVADNITAFITNFCGPEDVPAFSDYTGIDTTLGMNDKPGSTVRNTIVADPGATSGVAGNGGDGLSRLQASFGNNDSLVRPSYERYGFSSLHWTNFGSGCFSIGYWFSPISNLAFTLAVKLPMIVAMAVLHLAMDNVLYDVFTVIISPFVKVFTAIFTPWIFFIAPIGVFWVWMKSKGSSQAVLKAAVWVLCIYGVFAWMGNNTSTLVTKANNFVTQFAGTAASKISETATGKAAAPNDPLGAIDQALWHGVPYQTWLVGEVGDSQAGADQVLEKAGKLGWGPAILNGLYIGNDDLGKKVEANRQDWNNRSYAPNGDDTKTASWTTTNGSKSWNGIPLLTTVKFMCNDTAQGTESSGDEDKNKWLYGGQCDAAGAGTTNVVSHFTGATYNEQLIAAFAGGWATLAVVLSIMLASVYLALQKMLFFFLLLFGPIFLAISTFADEKRRAFAKRYFELLIANVIKQCAAVCVVLFVSYSMSNLLYPPADLGVPTIPWMLKPAVAMLFFIALVMFLIPMRNILTAAAKGDVSIVDKTAQAPVNAAKTAAKVAVVAGAAVATGGLALAAGGTSLGAAAMAGGKVGSVGQALTTASRMVGSRGTAGKALRVMGQGANLGQQIGNAQIAQRGKKEGILQGAMGLIKDNPGKYATDPKTGKPTDAALASAKKDFQKDAQTGVTAGRAQASFNAAQAAGFAGHLKRTGKHHAMDPQNPDNIKAAALAKENERLDTQETAKGGRARNANGAETNPVAVNGDAVQSRFAKQADDLMNAPKFARNPDIKANTTSSGADVLAGMNVTQGQAAQNPGLLLTGQAYNGGDTTAMDPRHPTTAALTELKFAAVNGTEQERQIALMKASQSIGVNGVPDEISSIRTTGATAQAFQGASVVGAMTPLGENTTSQQRAQAATTMQGAVAQMPADHPSSERMQAYVKALADPVVPAGEVEALRAQAVNSVGAASAGLSPQAYSAFSAYEAAKADPKMTTAQLQPLEKKAAEAVLASPPEAVKYADDSADQIYSWAQQTADRYAVTPDPVNQPAMFAVAPAAMAGAAARQADGDLTRRESAARYMEEQRALGAANPDQDALFEMAPAAGAFTSTVGDGSRAESAQALAGQPNPNQDSTGAAGGSVEAQPMLPGFTGPASAEAPSAGAGTGGSSSTAASPAAPASPNPDQGTLFDQVPLGLDSTNVNGVQVGKDADYQTMASAVGSLPEEHPARQALASYEQALDTTSTSPAATESSRREVLQSLGVNTFDNEPRFIGPDADLFPQHPTSRAAEELRVAAASGAAESDLAGLRQNVADQTARYGTAPAEQGAFSEGAASTSVAPSSAQPQTSTEQPSGFDAAGSSAQSQQPQQPALFDMPGADRDRTEAPASVEQSSRVDAPTASFASEGQSSVAPESARGVEQPALFDMPTAAVAQPSAQSAAQTEETSRFDTAGPAVSEPVQASRVEQSEQSAAQGDTTASAPRFEGAAATAQSQGARTDSVEQPALFDMPASADQPADDRASGYAAAAAVGSAAAYGSERGSTPEVASAQPEFSNEQGAVRAETASSQSEQQGALFETPASAQPEARTEQFSGQQESAAQAAPRVDVDSVATQPQEAARPEQPALFDMPTSADRASSAAEQGSAYPTASEAGPSYGSDRVTAPEVNPNASTSEFAAGQVSDRTETSSRVDQPALFDMPSDESAQSAGQVSAPSEARRDEPGASAAPYVSEQQPISAQPSTSYDTVNTADSGSASEPAAQPALFDMPEQAQAERPDSSQGAGYSSTPSGSDAPYVSDRAVASEVSTSPAAQPDFRTEQASAPAESDSGQPAQAALFDMPEPAVAAERPGRYDTASDTAEAVTPSEARRDQSFAGDTESRFSAETPSTQPGADQTDYAPRATSSESFQADGERSGSRDDQAQAPLFSAPVDSGRDQASDSSYTSQPEPSSYAGDSGARDERDPRPAEPVDTQVSGGTFAESARSSDEGTQPSYEQPSLFAGESGTRSDAYAASADPVRTGSGQADSAESRSDQSAPAVDQPSLFDHQPAQGSTPAEPVVSEPAAYSNDHEVRSDRAYSQSDQTEPSAPVVGSHAADLGRDDSARGSQSESVDQPALFDYPASGQAGDSGYRDDRSDTRATESSAAEEVRPSSYDGPSYPSDSRDDGNGAESSRANASQPFASEPVQDSTPNHDYAAATDRPSVFAEPSDSSSREGQPAQAAQRDEMFAGNEPTPVATPERNDSQEQPAAYSAPASQQGGQDQGYDQADHGAPSYAPSAEHSPQGQPQPEQAPRFDGPGPESATYEPTSQSGAVPSYAPDPAPQPEQATFAAGPSDSSHEAPRLDQSSAAAGQAYTESTQQPEAYAPAEASHDQQQAQREDQGGSFGSGDRAEAPMVVPFALPTERRDEGHGNDRDFDRETDRDRDRDMGHGSSRGSDRDDLGRHGDRGDRGDYDASDRRDDRHVPDSQGWDLDGYGSGQTSSSAAGFNREAERRDDQAHRQGDSGRDAANEVRYAAGGGEFDRDRDGRLDRDELRDALRDVRQEDAHFRQGGEPVSLDPTMSASSEAASQIVDGGVISEGLAARQMRTGNAVDAPKGPSEADAHVEASEKDEDTSRQIFRRARRRRISGLFGGDDSGSTDETEERDR